MFQNLEFHDWRIYKKVEHLSFKINSKIKQHPVLKWRTRISKQIFRNGAIFPQQHSTTLFISLFFQSLVTIELKNGKWSKERHGRTASRGLCPLASGFNSSFEKRRGCYRQAETVLLGEDLMDCSDLWRGN